MSDMDGTLRFGRGRGEEVSTNVPSADLIALGDRIDVLISGPTDQEHERETPLCAAWLESPLGLMLAVADERSLLLLEFLERRGLVAALERLASTVRFVPGRTAPIDSVDRELDGYFAGRRREFATPVALRGSAFQQGVWRQLQRIPAGSTLSYLQLAHAVGSPKGFRAVAQANGANQLAVIVPCHRVINASGELGGYGGGVERKRWLLEHERAHFGAEAGRLF